MIFRIDYGLSNNNVFRFEENLHVLYLGRMRQATVAVLEKHWSCLNIIIIIITIKVVMIIIIMTIAIMIIMIMMFVMS